MVTALMKRIAQQSKAQFDAVKTPVVVVQPPPVAPVENNSGHETTHRSEVLKGVQNIDRWLKEEAKKLLKQPVNEKTVEQYRRNGQRLNLDRVKGEPIDLEKFEGSPSTFYAYRAAVKFLAAERGIEAIKSYEKARAKEDAQAKALAYQIILECAADLKKFATEKIPLPERKKLESLGLADKKPRLKTEGAASKRETAKLKDANGIAKKYPDWRSLVWKRLTEINSRWLDQAALAALTGARPEELKSVEVQKIKNSVRVRLKGAKVSDTKGQPWREFLLKDDGSQEFQHLLKISDFATKDIAVGSDVTDYPDAFSAALSRAGAQVLLKAPRMSGYVYRHAFASDLKADGFSREQIAAALGHAVTKTQDTYGRAIGGSSGKRALSVTCARSIKTTHDSRFTNPATGLENGGLVNVDMTQETGGNVDTYTFQTPNWDGLGL